MLRAALILAAALGLVLVAALMIAGWFVPGFVTVILWGGMILIGLVFERRRYKPILDAAPGPDWERTAERFVDPASGRTLTVYYRPATGERAYVR